MMCPNCGSEMELHDFAATGRDWFGCNSCGLSGPREAIKALDARLSPHGTLTEAERLLRAAGSPLVCPRFGAVIVCKSGVWADGKDIASALAALEAKLEAKP